MADNTKLGAAKTAKNDEFYTQYNDIEAEINAYIEFNPKLFRGKTILLPCDDPDLSNFTKYFVANFERFGLKKLISSSYAKGVCNKQLASLEMGSTLWEEEDHESRGKLFTLTRSKDGLRHIEFSGYLQGDGDFRSEEVTRLRDEADIIITNPPFSQFRDFLAWIMDGKKQFIIMGNKNAITYKEIFPLLKANKVWTGFTPLNGGRWMILPKSIKIKSDKAKEDDNGNKILNVAGVCWYTNINHGKRYTQLQLDDMAHNLKFNKKLKKKLENEYGTIEYPRYDNYNAIEVPFVECIPSDYDGIMGVPITFIDNYTPEQFEIIGCTESEGKGFSAGLWDKESGVTQPLIGGVRKYKRIFIRPKKKGNT